jgi:hypothetical protein
MRAGTTYRLEREDNMSDCSCDNKRGLTYSLKVEREADVLDRGCSYKTRVGTTYTLDVEREGDMSDCS